MADTGNTTRPVEKLEEWCRVTVLEEELGRMSPDMGAIEAYRKKDADYCARVQELEAATAERDEVPLWSPPFFSASHSSQPVA